MRGSASLCRSLSQAFLFVHAAHAYLHHGEARLSQLQNVSSSIEAARIERVLGDRAVLHRYSSVSSFGSVAHMKAMKQVAGTLTLERAFVQSLLQ